MFGPAARGQAHHDEAGQRRGFEKPAALGLELLDSRQAVVEGQSANQAGQRVRRPLVIEAGLAHGHEGGDRKARQRHAELAQLLRQTSHFKGKAGTWFQSISPANA